jgi:ClpP class serine protease
VATARRLEIARVREIGEGHVFLGPDAIRLGLCDRVAGLDETIDAAKRAARIPEKRKARVTEFPKPPLIRLPAFLTGVLARGGGEDVDAAAETSPALTYEARVLQGILDQPGRPLLLAPGSLLPAELEAADR